MEFMLSKKLFLNLIVKILNKSIVIVDSLRLSIFNCWKAIVFTIHLQSKIDYWY